MCKLEQESICIVEEVGLLRFTHPYTASGYIGIIILKRKMVIQKVIRELIPYGQVIPRLGIYSKEKIELSKRK